MAINYVDQTRLTCNCVYLLRIYQAFLLLYSIKLCSFFHKLLIQWLKELSHLRVLKHLQIRGWFHHYKVYILLEKEEYEEAIKFVDLVLNNKKNVSEKTYIRALARKIELLTYSHNPNIDEYMEKEITHICKNLPKFR